MTAWFVRRHGVPTPIQAAAWPHVAAGRHALIVAPTGTGKTLAAFLAVLGQLSGEAEAGVLPDTIQAIYLSPLRALGYDLEKNLREPLREVYGDESPIRVGLRSGDTPAAERQRQWAKPPHLLLTTPESLLILLGQTKWQPVLAGVRWVIVDELHALAETKRGAHLSLSLERLEWLAASSAGSSVSVPAAERRAVIQRIGLSATVAPLETMAKFLAGVDRPCRIVDVWGGKRVELRVHTPLAEDPYPVSGFTGSRLIADLGELVRRHRTTLVFTNTRSGAEGATFWLRSAVPELANQIECHHASLDREVRLGVEDRLKRGELRAVVCSTSLELGIDIGSVDVVVMLATPKGVSRALQRTGRAGHNIRTVSRGVLMATNLNDLVECCATALLARRRELDAVRVPNAPLDVLAQHLVGWGAVGRWTKSAALALVRRAYPYRDLAEADFADVLEYLAGGGRSLRRRYEDLFGRIVLDAEGFETRRGTVLRDFLQNAGTIPNEGLVQVRLKGRGLGSIEEGFVRSLQPGDVFLLGGRAVRLVRVGGMEATVERADSARPTVPRWNANKMPLSNRVAAEIAEFRSGLRRRWEESGIREAEDVAWLRERLECDAPNAAIVHRTYLAQHRLSEIPTAELLLVEEFVTEGETDSRDGEEASNAGSAARRRWRQRVERMRADGPARHYFFHSLIGRAANDALSRLVARRLGLRGGGNAVATPDDYGFVLTVAREQAITVADLPGLVSPENLERDILESLERSALLKYHFRNAAQTGLMVYRNQLSRRKSVRKLQFSAEVIYNVLVEHEPDHVLLREARREALSSYLDLEGARSWAERAVRQPMRLRRVERVPPLSFALYATRIREALMTEDPAATLERLYRLWWERIGSGDRAVVDADAPDTGRVSPHARGT